MSLRNTILLLTNLVLFVACSTSVKYAKYDKNGAYLNDSVHGTDQTIKDLIAPYKKELDSSMNQVLNNSVSIMERGTPEGTLGNFVSDLCMNVAQQLGKEADFCILNNGGLRVPLPQGEITRGKLFELMPFENQLVIITLDNNGMSELFSYVAAKKGIPVSKEITIKYKNWKLEEAFINNIKYDSTKIYKIITSDYLARGGDNMNFFSKKINSENIDIKLRDAIIKFVEDEGKANRPINSKLDNRISNAQ